MRQVQSRDVAATLMFAATLSLVLASFSFTAEAGFVLQVGNGCSDAM